MGDGPESPIAPVVECDGTTAFSGSGGESDYLEEDGGRGDQDALRVEAVPSKRAEAAPGS